MFFIYNIIILNIPIYVYKKISLKKNRIKSGINIKNNINPYLTLENRRKFLYEKTKENREKTYKKIEFLLLKITTICMSCNI